MNITISIHTSLEETLLIRKLWKLRQFNLECCECQMKFHHMCHWEMFRADPDEHVNMSCFCLFDRNTLVICREEYWNKYCQCIRIYVYEVTRAFRYENVLIHRWSILIKFIQKNSNQRQRIPTSVFNLLLGGSQVTTISSSLRVELYTRVVTVRLVASAACVNLLIDAWVSIISDSDSFRSEIRNTNSF